MRKLFFALVAVAVVLPLAANALDYTDVSASYKDAPFSKPEAAAISLLTKLGIVSGNPDGTFAPRRALTRAEFLKIALVGNGMTIGASQSCFPDVRSSDWFSSYVCTAQTNGVIQGYDDGLFRPDRSVNYAEALKILVKLGHYSLSTQSGEAWYEVYFRAAAAHGTLLPVSVDADTPLTRGEMARLTAGFVAEAHGELAAYRSAEQGQISSVSSSSSSSSSVSSSVSSSSSSSSVSSSSSFSSVSSSVATTIPGLPVHTRFLTIGTTTLPIGSATFVSPLEPAIVRIVTVKFLQEVKSIDSLQIVDSHGVSVGKLILDVTDDTHKTWRGTMLDSGAYVIPQNEERVLAVVPRLKTTDMGGRTEELVQILSFTLTVEGQWSGNSFNSSQQSFTFPKHQTVQGMLTNVKNALDPQGVLQRSGTQLLAAFSFSGSTVPGPLPLAVENLEFQVGKSDAVVVTDWQLGTPGGNTRIPCSANAAIVSCSSIPTDMGSIGATPRVLQLYGTPTVDQGATNVFLQIQLVEPGSLDTLGAVQWTDGAGHYRWLDVPFPVSQGTVWKN